LVLLSGQAGLGEVPAEVAVEAPERAEVLALAERAEVAEVAPEEPAAAVAEEEGLQPHR
jgi:hypothetical protein